MRKLILIIVAAALVAVGLCLGLRQDSRRLVQGLGLAKTPAPRTLSINPKARSDDADQLQKDWQEAQRKRRVLEEAARNAK